jgi:glycerol dehydrogenase
MTRVFGSPESYVQGRDATSEIGDYAASLGESALLLADEVVLDLVEADATESLESNGIDVETELFEGECSAAEIERVGGLASEVDAEFVIGAGGGKALDTAKAVGEDLGIGVVSMPTIASTDAPCSALSVIYSERGEFQEYRFLDRHPDLVLVDTALVASAPTRFFTSGIGDALATWFEADATKCSDSDNILGGRDTDAGHQLARLCYDRLRENGVSAVDAVENDAVTPSVETVTEANTLLSGLGFESGGLAAAHAIHNGLTQLEATHEATHGEKVNVGTLSQLVLEGRSDEFVEDVVRFSLDVDLPVTLADIGLDDPTDDQLTTVAEAACAPDETIHNEPFDVTPEAVRDAIRTADAIGERVSSRY